MILLIIVYLLFAAWFLPFMPHPLNNWILELLFILHGGYCFFGTAVLIFFGRILIVIAEVILFILACYLTQAV